MAFHKGLYCTLLIRGPISLHFQGFFFFTDLREEERIPDGQHASAGYGFSHGAFVAFEDTIFFIKN